MAASESQRRFTALLADDVPNLRLMFRIALEMSGRFEIVGEADTGDEAIELTERHRPDIVLLDVSMPGKDGLESLPELIRVSPDSAVVILSGFEAGRLAPVALRLGAKAYLEKGIRPEALVARLLTILDDAPRSGSPEPLVAVDDDVTPDELLSFVAHEIRNPLAILQGFGMTLESHWDKMGDEQRLDVVRRMTQGARYLDSVVTSVLHMRSLEAGQLPVVVEVVDPGEALNMMVEELRRVVDGRHLRVSVDHDLPRVALDTARLRQVITNLLVNALKYGDAGSPIGMSARRESGELVIRIVDEGPGIPPVDRERVFGKFTRLQNAGKGLGLGLYISRALVQTMGGTIRVEDGTSGTTVAIRFPAAH